MNRIRATVLATAITWSLIASACSTTGSGSADQVAVTASTKASGKPGALLQSRAVLDIAAPGSTHYDDLRPTCQEDECTATELDAAAEVVLEGDDGNRFLLGPAAWDQDNVLTAEVNKDDAYKGWTVDASLDEQGTAAFSAVTEAALRVAPPGNQVAIVLNGLVVSAPAVMAPITSGRFQLTGLTKAQAEEIAGLE